MKQPLGLVSTMHHSREALCCGFLTDSFPTGIERPDDNGSLMFQDYGRFSDLMSSTDPLASSPRETFADNQPRLARDNRTPSLVSFVGQTGAGKSTLVKLMIDFGLVGNSQSYSTPVIGPPGALLPTSEDVHLYMDPRTAQSSSPLLYADCEGLEGGEREPLAAKFRRKTKSISETNHEMAKQYSRAGRVVSERELMWADEPRSRSREFVVTNLYPRLLYTFSDVIVFVLREHR